MMGEYKFTINRRITQFHINFPLDTGLEQRHCFTSHKRKVATYTVLLVGNNGMPVAIGRCLRYRQTHHNNGFAHRLIGYDISQRFGQGCSTAQCVGLSTYGLQCSDDRANMASPVG
ncbi:hypothetical protein A6456_36660 [Paraburkholderia tropica]|nr:hypothetical protein A6456_36660 [Paraburkholderia tropica]